MSTEIYIQARMGSTRLPGKTLKQIGDKSLLEILLERLKNVTRASNLCVLTTQKKEDDAIVRFCEKKSIFCFRGPDEDVLSRYSLCAQQRKPSRIVRITGDCPLIDPAVVDTVITAYSPEYDYVSNTLTRTYPRGMDVEIFSYEALQKASSLAKTPSEREHVTLYMYQHPESFRLLNVASDQDFSHLRLTVDTQEDFEVVKRIFEHLYPKNPRFTLQDIIAAVKIHPEWITNAHIQQKKV